VAKKLQDVTNGIIVNFGVISYQTPPILGSKTWYTNALAFAGKTYNPGRENLNVTYFSQAIITSKLILGNITYTANGNGSTYPQYDNGHYVSFEIELFGCDSFVIDSGKNKN
jgi:hypothetical protein